VCVCTFSPPYSQKTAHIEPRFLRIPMAKKDDTLDREKTLPLPHTAHATSSPEKARFLLAGMLGTWEQAELERGEAALARRWLAGMSQTQYVLDAQNGVVAVSRDLVGEGPDTLGARLLKREEERLEALQRRRLVVPAHPSPLLAEGKEEVAQNEAGAPRGRRRSDVDADETGSGRGVKRQRLSVTDGDYVATRADGDEEDAAVTTAAASWAASPADEGEPSALLVSDDSVDVPLRISMFSIMSSEMAEIMSLVYDMVRRTRVPKSFYWKCDDERWWRDMVTVVTPYVSANRASAKDAAASQQQCANSESPKFLEDWLYVRSDCFSERVGEAEFARRALELHNANPSGTGANPIVKMCSFCNEIVSVEMPFEESCSSESGEEAENPTAALPDELVDLSQYISHVVCASCKHGLLLDPSLASAEDTAYVDDLGLEEDPEVTRNARVSVLGTLPQFHRESECRILVVDDDPMTLQIMKRYLNRIFDKNVHVVTAADGVEAVEKFALGDFGAVLTDLVMPRMGGVSVIRQCREQRPDLVLVAISGSASEFPAANEAGADDCLLKPITLQGLAVIMGQLMGEKDAAPILPHSVRPLV
jgi:CheY-like chemotaxis protein